MKTDGFFHRVIWCVPAAVCFLRAGAVGATAGEESWVRGAEEAFQQGLAAESQGRPDEARKKYILAFKRYAREAHEDSLPGLRSALASLFNMEGVESPPAATENVVPPVDIPAVSEVESSTRTYSVAIDPEDPAVKKYLALYTGPWRERTQAAFERMGRYAGMIRAAIAEAGLPGELIYLPVVESEYQVHAVSRVGATGLWQFMPATAKYAGLKINYWVDERRDPEKATRAALATLKYLYDWFDDWALALAAYNRGVYGIQRDLEFTRSTDFSLLSKRQGLPEETEQYVPKWKAVVLIGEHPEKYGFRWSSATSTTATVDVVPLPRALDIKVAAACAGVSEGVIRELNPSLRLWVTPSTDLPFALRIPSGKKDSFSAALAQVKDWTPSPGFLRYTVQKGDILGRIAARFRTTPTAIQRENRLPSAHRLRPGQLLVIRPGRGFKSQ